MANEKLSPEEDSLQLACGIFLCSSDESTTVDEYNKLVKAADDGRGDDFAESHATVWDKVGLTVDAAIEQIEQLQESFMDFLKVELVLWEDVRKDMKYPKSDNNRGYGFGLNLLDNNKNILDVQWFRKESERDTFIKQNKLKVI